MVKPAHLPVILAQPNDWFKLFNPSDWTMQLTHAQPLGVGTAVIIDVNVGGWASSLHGTVERSSGDGPYELLIAVAGNEREKINYLNGFLRGGLLNHRENTRRPMGLPVTYGAVGGPAKTFTKDVSEEGLYLLTDEPLPPSSQIHMLISLPGKPGPFSVMGRVAYANPVGQDAYPGMGIVFLFEQDQQAEWLELLAQLART